MNPYTPSSSTLFYGREQIMRDLLADEQQGQSVVLIGGRRPGGLDGRNLWLRVNGQLILFDVETKDARLVRSIDGLAVQAVSALAVDGTRRVWVSLKDNVYYRDPGQDVWHRVAAGHSYYDKNIHR